MARAQRIFIMAIALVATAGLVAACHGGSQADPGTFTANGEEPSDVLIPADSTTNAGIKVLDNVFAGLVSYTDEGHTRMDAAESVTSADQKLWTVTVAKDRKFSDGSPVTAQSFVKAWKESAKEKLKETYPYAPIVGAQADGTGDLTGLKATGERTFTVQLKYPIAGFADRLGQNAFYPLPAAAYDGSGKIKRDFGKAPIGNGPYKFAGKDAWVHNQYIKLVKNDRYRGPRVPKNQGFTLKFYTKAQGAYNDLLAGHLDVLDSIPPNALGSFRKELKGRSVSMPVAGADGLDVDLTAAPHLGNDQEGRLRRHAISMAINRQAIVKKIFHSTREPATDFLPPVISGHTDNLDADGTLSFNPQRARQLWQQADAISRWSGKLPITYNSDGGHREYIEAIAHQLTQNLGIQAVPDPLPDFSAQLDADSKHQLKGLFRMGWFMGYPQADNLLTGRFLKGGAGNESYYDSPDFVAALSKAQRATGADAKQAYIDAQKVLLRDMPTIPLWSKNVNGGWSPNVAHVRFSWNGNPAYDEITVTK